MPYCVDSDLDLAFGRDNVRKWADANNNRLETEVVARKLWARQAATDELDASLAASEYQFPLDDAEPYPGLLVRMCAYLAGVLLYESRGVTDVDAEGRPQHSLMWFRRRVEQFIKDLHGRRIKLVGATLRSAAVETTQVPEFVSLEDPADETYVTEIEDNLINFPMS